MKEIKLENLRLRNFKGIKELDVSSPEDIEVYGDNATGKTTIFDSFWWLLFDKDSQGNSTQSFEIKTLDEDNNVIHHLDHEVKAVLDVNGEKLELKKIYKEKWTKKRGTSKETFSGHTTDYYVDEVPVKKKEYDSKIEELVEEDIFKLLTNPGYFNEELHWKDRREILEELAGKVDIDEVIKNNKALKGIKDILGKHGVSDKQKVIKSKMNNINKEIKKIPIRIDEANNSKNDIKDYDKKSIQEDINDMKSLIKDHNEEISKLENGDTSEKQKRISEIEKEIIDLQNSYSKNNEKDIEKLRKEKEDIKEKYYTKKEKLSEVKSNIKSLKSTLSRLQENRENLVEKWGIQKKKWKTKNSEIFEYDGTCPTCGQELPEGEIEKHKASFNKNKVKELKEIKSKMDEITKKGKVIKGEIEADNKNIARMENQVETLEKEVKTFNKKANDIKAKIDENKEKADKYKADDKYKELISEFSKIEDEISNLKKGNKESIQKEKESIKLLEDDIEKEQSKLQEIKQNDKLDKRIEELSEQEKDLATEYEELERQEFLLEEYTRAKVNLIEDKVNSKFKYASFKLFENQVNGGLKETCQTLYKGVPYDGGLNNAAKINIGLDIINTLSIHYEFSAPIFVDNAESVTKIFGCDTQMIKLIVSEKDKNLRIETQEKLEADKSKEVA